MTGSLVAMVPQVASSQDFGKFYRPSPLRSLDALPPAEAAAAAVVLGQRGDSTGYWWIRARLARSRPGEDVMPVIAAAARLRDDGSTVPLVLRLRSGTPREQHAAYQALLAIATPEVWRQLVDQARRDSTISLRILRDWVRTTANQLPRDDPGFRAASAEIARAALRSADPELVANGSEVVVQLGATEAIPSLLAMLMRDSTQYALATSALIRLTGVDNPPAGPVATPGEQRLAWLFWNDWWQARQRSQLRAFLVSLWPGGQPPSWLLAARRVKAVPLSEGDAALRRFRSR
ncbi:MAG TPA: hypothetical protein VEK85_16995 [Gemmatimonadales bacterium]|nr:hypothetical protein [Gemmatimonadales bacterium]